MDYIQWSCLQMVAENEDTGVNNMLESLNYKAFVSLQVLLFNCKIKVNAFSQYFQYIISCI